MEHGNINEVQTGTLAQGAALHFRDASGTQLCVDDGVAWITQECDNRDLIVMAGESFTLDRNGLAVVQMLKPGSLRIVAELRPRCNPIQALARRLVRPVCTPATLS